MHTLTLPVSISGRKKIQPSSSSSVQPTAHCPHCPSLISTANSHNSKVFHCLADSPLSIYWYRPVSFLQFQLSNSSMNENIDPDAFSRRFGLPDLRRSRLKTSEQGVVNSACCARAHLSTSSPLMPLASTNIQVRKRLAVEKHAINWFAGVSSPAPCPPTPQNTAEIQPNVWFSRSPLPVTVKRSALSSKRNKQTATPKSPGQARVTFCLPQDADTLDSTSPSSGDCTMLETSDCDTTWCGGETQLQIGSTQLQESPWGNATQTQLDDGWEDNDEDEEEEEEACGEETYLSDKVEKSFVHLSLEESPPQFAVMSPHSSKQNNHHATVFSDKSRRSSLASEGESATAGIRRIENDALRGLELVMGAGGEASFASDHIGSCSALAEDFLTGRYASGPVTQPSTADRCATRARWLFDGSENETLTMPPPSPIHSPRSARSYRSNQPAGQEADPIELSPLRRAIDDSDVTHLDTIRRSASKSIVRDTSNIGGRGDKWVDKRGSNDDNDDSNNDGDEILSPALVGYVSAQGLQQRMATAAATMARTAGTTQEDGSTNAPLQEGEEGAPHHLAPPSTAPRQRSPMSDAASSCSSHLSSSNSRSSTGGASSFVCKRHPQLPLDVDSLGVGGFVGGNFLDDWASRVALSDQDVAVLSPTAASRPVVSQPRTRTRDLGLEQQQHQRAPPPTALRDDNDSSDNDGTDDNISDIDDGNESSDEDSERFYAPARQPPPPTAIRGHSSPSFSESQHKSQNLGNRGEAGRPGAEAELLRRQREDNVIGALSTAVPAEVELAAVATATAAATNPVDSIVDYWDNTSPIGSFSSDEEDRLRGNNRGSPMKQAQNTCVRRYTPARSAKKSSAAKKRFFGQQSEEQQQLQQHEAPPQQWGQVRYASELKSRLLATGAVSPWSDHSEGSVNEEDAAMGGQDGARNSRLDTSAASATSSGNGGVEPLAWAVNRDQGHLSSSSTVSNGASRNAAANLAALTVAEYPALNLAPHHHHHQHRGQHAAAAAAVFPRAVPGGVLVHSDNWELASECLRQMLETDAAATLDELNDSTASTSSATNGGGHAAGGSTGGKKRTLIVGSRSAINKWCDLLKTEAPLLAVLNVCAKRLQPRLAAVLASDVVLCTLESLAKHRSQDPWGILDATDGNSGHSRGGGGGNTGARNEPGGRRRSAREGGWLVREPEAQDQHLNAQRVKARRRPTRRTNSGTYGDDCGDDYADEEGADEEHGGVGGGPHVRVACHALLHKVKWARLVVDDAHVLFAAAPSKLAPRSNEGGGASRYTNEHGISGGAGGTSRTSSTGSRSRGSGGSCAKGAAALSPSDAKAEALSWIRAKSRWCVLSASKAPKLWRSREQLRNLVTAVGAPPDVSLVRLVPELVLELE